jgi:hypothetical protein
MLLNGALEAEAKVGLKMNIAEKNLAKLLKAFARTAQSDDCQFEFEGLGRRRNHH